MRELHIPPIALDDASRVAMTVSCRDCDLLPKVSGAGNVVPSGGQRVQIMHNGIKVVAGGYYGSWMMEIIEHLQGHHEPQEEVVYHEIMKHIAPEATMLELGGFWSYYSLWFKSRHGDRRSSYVVEPDPNYIAVGRANAALNGQNIIFMQACVGAESVEAIDFRTESAGEIRIPQISVPVFMAEHRIDRLDMLHCDTQGMETKVVQSCEALFRVGAIRFGVFSTHHHAISGDPLVHQRCLAMIQDFGGRILAEHDVHESFSGDGLIAAYFGEEKLDWAEPPISRNRYSSSLFRNPLYDLAGR